MHIDRRNLIATAHTPDCVMVRGEGSYLWDDEGRRYLDFVQGWAVNALGHAPPELKKALCAQAGVLLTASPAYLNQPMLALAERLVRSTGMSRALFGSTGAEVNEVAFKIARKWGRIHRAGAFEVLTTDGGYHGRTLAAMAATGKPGFDAMFPPPVPGFRKVPFGELEPMRDAIDTRTAAILVEPIQGEAGVVVPPAGYLRGLRELADERGVLLMLDEVQTGMARTGTLYAFEQEGIVPDVVTLGKGLGGGFPVSAVIVSDRAHCLEIGEHGGTYGGNALAAAAGIVVFDVLSDPAFLHGVRARGERLERGLRALAARHRGVTHGRGLLWALELEGAPRAERVRDECLRRGLLVNAPRPTRIRLMPSLRVEPGEIDAALDVLDGALGSTA